MTSHILNIKKTLSKWVINGSIEIPYAFLPAQMKTIFRGCQLYHDKHTGATRISFPIEPSSAFISDISSYSESYFKQAKVPTLILSNFLKTNVIPYLPSPLDHLSDLVTSDNLTAITKRVFVEIITEISIEYQKQSYFASLLNDLKIPLSDHPITQVNSIRLLANKLETLEAFYDNPYKVSSSVPINLLDIFAKNLSQKRRIHGTLMYMLRKHLDTNGHTCYPMDQLIKEASYQTTHKDLKGFKDLFTASLEDEVFTIIETDMKYVYLTSVYHKEEGIAQKLLDLKSSSTCKESTERIESLIRAYERKTSTALSIEQKTAIVDLYTKSDVIVITGYPGTGKSTITKCIKYIFEEIHQASKDEEILFAAPTGIAANKLNDGRGMTIHRALQVVVGKSGKFSFQKSHKNPFVNKLIIIDEFSMVDIDLAHHLFDAIIAGLTKLVIIGDHNQLPSVGPGDILRHIIESGCIPTIKLTKIFRQHNSSSQNNIFELAKLINRGKIPSSEQIDNENIKFYNINDTEKIYQAIVKLFDKHDQKCQILFGTRKETTVGSIQGNKVIAAHVHPDSKNPNDSIGPFMKGDRIVCTKNSVAMDENGEIILSSSIYNGEIGIVGAIDKSINKLLFKSSTKSVNVFTDVIEHGWCITVNKSQGSEYDTVIVVLHPSQSIMLNRQVLYTAVTRAKKQLYIIGTGGSLSQAIKTEPQRRYTLLSSIILSKTEDD